MYDMQNLAIYLFRPIACSSLCSYILEKSHFVGKNYLNLPPKVSCAKNVPNAVLQILFNETITKTFCHS